MKFFFRVILLITTIACCKKLNAQDTLAQQGISTPVHQHTGTSTDTASRVISRMIGNERLGKKDSVANWTIHMQLTTVFQWHPSFPSAYSGPNSMNSNAEKALSLTSTLYIGRKLWKGATIYVNPELSGGSGLSLTKGMAGFPNGEIYRVGSPTPTPFFARMYIEQDIALKHTDYDVQITDQNQFAGKIPTSRISIIIGKFGISDFFDANTYSHEARTHFMNWSLMAAGAWDFPADTRGYTSGFIVAVIKPTWNIKFSGVMEPRIANGLPMDYHIGKANSETIQFEKSWGKKLPGAIRATGYLSFTKAPFYKNATKELLLGDSTLEKVIDGQAEGTQYGGIKYGFGLNAEQAITSYLGIFMRASWNDGHTATWAFTEIDNNFQLGMNLTGALWKRPMDNIGVAFASNGISADHLAYLRAGGQGFIIGDGKLLRYGHEDIIEVFYNVQISSFLWLSPDYQFCANPAYNKDRGPVNIVGFRLHVEI